MKANSIINLLSQYGKINGDEKHISMQRNGVVYEAMLNDTNTTNVVYVTYIILWVTKSHKRCYRAKYKRK